MNEGVVEGEIVPTRSGGDYLATVESGQSPLVAQARAETQARFIIARQNPRSWTRVEERLLDHLARPGFAEACWYRRPAGKKKNEETGQWEETYAEGFSIRFAETAVQALGNMDVRISLVYEDDTKQRLLVQTLDFESNTGLRQELDVAKTVERRRLKDGQAAIGERVNSYGDTVYIVRATDDEFAAKKAAAISKIFRGLVLKMVPPDIQEQCKEQRVATLNKQYRADPAAARRKLVDGFGKAGVRVEWIERYLGHSLDTATEDEFNDLRAVYAAITIEKIPAAQVMAEKMGDAEIPEGKKSAAQIGRETLERRAAAARAKEQHAKEQTGQASDPPAPVKEDQQTGDQDKPAHKEACDTCFKVLPDHVAGCPKGTTASDGSAPTDQPTSAEERKTGRKQRELISDKK